MTATPTLDEVTLVTVPEIPVAVLQHRGDPRQLGQSIGKFIAWRKAEGLPPSKSRTFNIFHPSPKGSDLAAFRLDLCASVTRDIGANDSEVRMQRLPAGRCAVLRFSGSDDGLEQAIIFLYTVWLPQSGETLREFPLYVERLRFSPEVPEAQALTDIYLPLLDR